MGGNRRNAGGDFPKNLLYHRFPSIGCGGRRRATGPARRTAAERGPVPDVFHCLANQTGSMAKRTINRRELRDQADAAQKRKGSSGDGSEEVVKSGKAKKAKEPKEPKEPKVKKAAGAKTKKTKTKVIVRKRLIWGVYSGTMKEEGRYAYADREAADNRAAELSAKHKKTFFVQPIKEPLGDAIEAEVAAAPPVE